MSYMECHAAMKALYSDETTKEYLLLAMNTNIVRILRVVKNKLYSLAFVIFLEISTISEAP